MGKGTEPENIEKIINFFNNRPEEWNIKIAGGEVTIHPKFVYLCQRLTERHNIQIITNNSISFERLNEFCDKISNKRVNQFSCSLQPFDEEGERLEKFIQRINILKSNSYKVKVTYVATIERLEKIHVIKKIFEDEGIEFSILPMLVGDGKIENYNEEQVALLGDAMNSVIGRYNLKGEAQIVYGTPCEYGYTKIQIHGDTGDIMACRKYTKPIGNIYTGELTLKKAPINCPFKYCDCPIVPLNMINEEFRFRKQSYDLNYHYDKDTEDEQFRKTVENPYYGNFNWNPCTVKEKEKSLESLKQAEKAGRMFYKAYKLQGDLYRDMGKPRYAGRAYKKAIALEPEHEENGALLKNARFMTLPYPVKKSVSMLRKVSKTIDRHYGYAEFRTLEELSFLDSALDVPVYDIEKVEFMNRIGIVLQCGENDPQLYLSLSHPLEKPAGISLCKVTYTNSVAGNFQIYWDFGEGLSEKNSTRYDIEPSMETASILLPIVNWNDDAKLTALRLDPPNGTEFVLKSIRILEDR
jgi:tetratricopeptide (TPR) repeat protein